MTILCVYEYTFLNEVVIKIVAVQNVSSLLLQEESKFSNITRAVSSFIFLFLKHSVKVMLLYLYLWYNFFRYLWSTFVFCCCCIFLQILYKIPVNELPFWFFIFWFVWFWVFLCFVIFYFLFLTIQLNYISDQNQMIS